MRNPDANRPILPTRQMKTMTDFFPYASQSFQAANRDLQPHPSNHGKVRIGRRGNMNRCEREFSLILEAQKQRGEILRWEFEPMTLRFAGVKYTPDFLVSEQTDSTYRDGHEFIKRIRLIEVKGSFIGGKFERAVERFRHARTFWPEFSFECHQKTKTGWKRIM